MIELLFILITAKQPSCPPPTPLPEKIVAIIPKELGNVKIENETLSTGKDGEKKSSKKKLQKFSFPRAKKTIYRRGIRNH